MSENNYVEGKYIHPVVIDGNWVGFFNVVQELDEEDMFHAANEALIDLVKSGDLRPIIVGKDTSYLALSLNDDPKQPEVIAFYQPMGEEYPNATDVYAAFQSGAAQITRAESNRRNVRVVTKLKGLLNR